MTIDDENDIYWTTEQKCRKYTKRIDSFAFIHPASFLPSLMFALSSIAKGKYDTSSWFLIFDSVLPIDTTRVWGWLLMWTIQISMGKMQNQKK